MRRKRFISLFMALTMLLTLMAPAFAFAEGTITVYFTDTQGWSDIRAYAWNGSGDITQAFPGNAMSAAGTNDYNQTIYSVTLNTQAVSGLIFSGINGANTRDQTIDITTGIENGTAWFVSGWDNGKATVGSFAVTCAEVGHNWGAATYVWAEDKSTCTATRVCANDPDHKETETVNSTSEVTTPATCEANGVTIYTATFTNEAFVQQTTTVPAPAANGHTLTATWCPCTMVIR